MEIEKMSIQHFNVLIKVFQCFNMRLKTFALS